MSALNRLPRPPIAKSMTSPPQRIARVADLNSGNTTARLMRLALTADTSRATTVLVTTGEARATAKLPILVINIVDESLNGTTAVRGQAKCTEATITLMNMTPNSIMSLLKNGRRNQGGAGIAGR
ncbi:hypothetical protein MVEN_01176900 [Mycena venus]|uniref:Uncharacterized protein n=1 Tax=Mycena venus TaxID=2733690 RepID=A0A8H7CXT6_9AGAR|nr:hypothetical protein MVEN_01176900 [Mycena venus]